MFVRDEIANGTKVNCLLASKQQETELQSQCADNIQMCVQRKPKNMPHEKTFLRRHIIANSSGTTTNGATVVKICHSFLYDMKSYIFIQHVKHAKMSDKKCLQLCLKSTRTKPSSCTKSQCICETCSSLKLTQKKTTSATPVQQNQCVCLKLCMCAPGGVEKPDFKSRTATTTNTHTHHKLGTMEQPTSHRNW